MKRFTSFLTILFALTFLNPVHAKRSAPSPVEPLTSKRGSIHYVFEKSPKGYTAYIRSNDRAGDMRWKTKIYHDLYRPNLETDVQDVHVKNLFMEEMDVIVIDELNRRYRLDVIDGTLQKGDP